MKINKLLWDSEFFGFNVGKIEVFNQSELDSYTKSNFYTNFKLIYIFDYCCIKTNLLISKFHELFENKINITLVDEKVIFKKKVNEYSYKAINDIEVYSNNYNDRETLYSLALLSGEYSRYRIDKKISDQYFKRLYKLWIDNSIDQNFADEIFIYKINNHISGFVTISITDGIGKIGLIAVDSIYQGMSIGRKLIEHCEYFCFENDAKYLEVPTQTRNKSAMNFYTKCGFNIEKVINIYHLWT